MGTLNRVYINSPENNGEFEFQAQNIDYTIPGSTIKTSVASVLKNLTEQTGDEGLAPTDHSSKTSEYGMASTTKYGHIKIGEGLIGPQGGGGFDTLPFNLKSGRNQCATDGKDTYIFIADNDSTIEFWILDQNGFSKIRVVPQILDNFDGYVIYISNTFTFVYGNFSISYDLSTRNWRSSVTLPFNINQNNSFITSVSQNSGIITFYSNDNNGYIFLDPLSGSVLPFSTLEISTPAFQLTGNFDNKSTVFIFDSYTTTMWLLNINTGVWDSAPLTTLGGMVSTTSYYYDHFFYIIGRTTSKPSSLAFIKQYGSRQLDSSIRSLGSVLFINDKFYIFQGEKVVGGAATSIYSHSNEYSSSWERDSLSIESNSSGITPTGPDPRPAPDPDPNALTIDPEYALDSDDERLEDERTPFPHASLDTRYGASTIELYGHSKLVDDYANVGLDINGESSVTISELSTTIWQRHNVAVNKNGEILAISSLDFNDDQWTPAYSFYSSTKPIVENQRHPVIYDFDSCQVECLNDDTFIIVGSCEPSYAGLYMYKITNDQWTRLSDLPFDFCNDLYSGQIAKDTFKSSSRDYEDSVLIMLYNSNLPGYVFYWYNEEDGLVSAFEEGDYLPSSYVDDSSGNTAYLYSNNLTLVITPGYYVVLDIYNRRMWKHTMDYSGEWHYSGHLLPIPDSYSNTYPSALVYGGDDINMAYLHIIGRNNDNGGIFHGTFDLFNMNWDEANTENISLRGYDSYNGEYSFILKDNKLYLFTDTDQNTTKIYSCRADTMQPVWVEDSITFDIKPSSKTCGGNGISASSYSVNMFKNDTLKQIATIMPASNFTDELHRRMEKYIKSS